MSRQVGLSARTGDTDGIGCAARTGDADGIGCARTGDTDGGAR